MNGGGRPNVKVLFPVFMVTTSVCFLVFIYSITPLSHSS